MSLRRSARALRAPYTAAALLAVAAAAAPAEAQFLKRVKQMAQDQVAEAVGARAAGAAHGQASRATVAITPERLDVFLAAMGPAVARAERLYGARQAAAAYEAAVAAYQRKREARLACSDSVRQRSAAPTPDRQLRFARENARATPELQALQAAMTSGSPGRMEAVQERMEAREYRLSKILYPGLEVCGAYQERPTKPPEPEPEPPVAPAAGAAGGMTAEQFGVLRERIAVYALTGGKQDPFTAEERAALDARAADLARLAPLFREGLLEWGHWYDLGKAWNAGRARP